MPRAVGLDSQNLHVFENQQFAGSSLTVAHEYSAVSRNRALAFI